MAYPTVRQRISNQKRYQYFLPKGTFQLLICIKNKKTQNNETSFEKNHNHISFLYAFDAIIWQFLRLYYIQIKSG